MGYSLNDIAMQLKENNKKVKLVYAFNGTGKTRLSREFKSVVLNDIESYTELEESGGIYKKILYYNAFTEDLFYWDNDLEFDIKPKLKIHTNSFTRWIFEDQGQDQNIISNFQRYSDEKLMPHFNEEYTKTLEGQNKKVRAFTEVSFSYERGNYGISDNIKISKGEESSFIWCVFYSLLEQAISILNVAEPIERETNQFDNLEYVFIDDPVSSLDDSHLIELAVDLAQLVKSSKSELKFVITTHSPLFYNVMHNELGRDDKSYSYKSKRDFEKYRLEKSEDGTFTLQTQTTDSPFSYHLHLKNEIERAIERGSLKKYHFNFLRNILEKTSTFLGYDNWIDLLPSTPDGNTSPYEKRIINISSHSKHSGDEVTQLSADDKRVLEYLLKTINENYKFK